jgi:hypothetical protein
MGWGKGVGISGSDSGESASEFQKNSRKKKTNQRAG